MKSVGLEQYHNGHSFRQYPIPGDETPPPFKPLNDYPTFNIPFESPDSEYGPPNHYSHLGHSSEKRQVAVNPKAYDIYHSMKKKMTHEKNFVTLPTLNDEKGLEIQKSIEYEIKA